MSRLASSIEKGARNKRRDESFTPFAALESSVISGGRKHARTAATPTTTACHNDAVITTLMIRSFSFTQVILRYRYDSTDGESQPQAVFQCSFFLQQTAALDAPGFNHGRTTSTSHLERHRLKSEAEFDGCTCGNANHHEYVLQCDQKSPGSDRMTGVKTGS